MFSVRFFATHGQTHGREPLGKKADFDPNVKGPTKNQEPPTLDNSAVLFYTQHKEVSKIPNKLTPDELLSRLETEQNITISRGTLQRWTRAELVPQPETGSYGRGRGRFTLYPEQAVAEAVASYAILRHETLRPTIPAVAEARREAIAAHRFFEEEMPKLSPEEFRAELEKGLDNKFLDARFRQLPYGWLMIFLKARERFPFRKPVIVRYVYTGPGQRVRIQMDRDDGRSFGVDFRYEGEAADIIRGLRG